MSPPGRAVGLVHGSPRSERPVVVFDARCLQDPNYAPRGVGRHAAGLLRDRPSAARALRLVALTDTKLPPLAAHLQALFDRVYITAYGVIHGESRAALQCFVSLSPMTHDPLFTARLHAEPSMLRVAVVYDFIPMREPERYLPGPTERLDYACQLRWLATSDLFCPISQSAADDLAGLLNVSRDAVVVTGATVDPAFKGANADARGERPDILVVGGGDPRKNPETVIRAHASSSLFQEKRVVLTVAGNYGPADAEEFRRIAAKSGGHADLVQVPGHVPGEVLLALYRRARVVVSASRDEGFSLPVVEGMAAGAFVLASDIPAHAELIPDPARRFAAMDHAALRQKLEQAFTGDAWRTEVLAEQASVWPKFLSAEVSGRFWRPVMAQLSARAARPQVPAVLRGRRPKVALLSPMPPDRSGVADYTAAMCADLGELVDLHVFTATERPLPQRGVATMRGLDALPNLMPGFDRVVGVLGNSHFHQRVFEQLERYGGAAIAHDARMLGFYQVLLGQGRALQQASAELGRPVDANELNGWLMEEATLKTLFLGEIAAFASPMIVHSRITAGMVRERHGVEPALLPFSIYRPWRPEELTPPQRSAARARLNLPGGEIVIATFGYVHNDKGARECLWALDFLRAWGIDASLHFVGGLINMRNNGADLRALVDELGLTNHVRVFGDFVSEQVYKDYCVGADLAIQLRAYTLGGLSGALLDCAAAGLPCVSNVSLADAVSVPPGYNRVVPDLLNPILLAEACKDLVDSGVTAERCESERDAFSHARSFKVYATELCKVLQLDVKPPRPGGTTHKSPQRGVAA